MKKNSLFSWLLRCLIYIFLITTAISCGNTSNRREAKSSTYRTDNLDTKNTHAKTNKSFDINVFLENSGSMNGYLNDPNTQFKNSVYSLLTRLKLFAGNKKLNLNLVNEEDQLLYPNATNEDIIKFKNILNPAEFKKISAKKTGQSDLNDLLNRSLSKANQDNLSVFISDCIYSPGKEVHDAAQYLVEQREGIYLNFATKLKQRKGDVAVIVLQLYGKFKGIYYDHLNNKINIETPIERPFYIWFIGTNDQITQIIKSKKLEEIEGGYSNKFILQSKEKIAKSSYKVVSKPVAGNFEKGSMLSKGIINGAESSSNDRNIGAFGFNIAVDFSENLQDENYLLSSKNYIVNSTNYKISCNKIKDLNNKSLENYTHFIKCETNKLREEELKIELIAKLPEWIIQSSSIEDSKMLSNKTEHKKTFGFSYLVEGVYNAFYPKSSNNTINMFNISIKK